MHGTAQDVTHGTRIAYRPIEVAEFLGVSRRTAYRLLESGELPKVTVGARLMVLAKDLDAYIERLKEAA